MIVPDFYMPGILGKLNFVGVSFFPLILYPSPCSSPKRRGDHATTFFCLNISSKHTGIPEKKIQEITKLFTLTTVKTPSPLLLGEEQGEG